MQEVLSPPRCEQKAFHAGLRTGVAIDILTGFDVASAEGYKLAWGQLTSDNSRVVTISPPCRMWSSCVKSSRSRMNKHKYCKQYREARKQMDFACGFADWCVKT